MRGRETERKTETRRKREGGKIETTRGRETETMIIRIERANDRDNKKNREGEYRDNNNKVDRKTE